jgi:protein-L-isoaspartate(D-aspartate) O-methyltransferase
MVMVAYRQPDFAIARKRMIQEQMIARGISDQNVLRVMEQLPRHLFVDEALKDQAYIDAPLSIREGQTISQPYIVALMSQALNLTGTEKVLEIGTGCGYQTTILAKLAKQVYTIERFKVLGMSARTVFKQMGLKNIVMRIGDGSAGWPEAAPFDRIVMTCASPEVPKRLLEQLAIGGIMVVPVATSPDVQSLLRITKTESGIETQDLGGCRFVKLVGKYGYA